MCECCTYHIVMEHKKILLEITTILTIPSIWYLCYGNGTVHEVPLHNPDRTQKFV
jgi:hypothetical protein